MTQIGSNLRPEEYCDFKAYAGRFQISQSAVANLLIIKELRRARLERLRLRHKEYRGLPEHRITANQRDPTIKAAFESHVARLGLGSDAAAGILFRAELRELWLDRILGPDQTNQFDSAG
jgi:hypothetical protein